MSGTGEQPPTAPGSEMVQTLLGLSVDELDDRHPRDSPQGQLARQTAAAAMRLDDLADQARRRAAGAARDLIRYANTSTLQFRQSGVLQFQGVEVDILAARTSDAHRVLESLCHSCLRAGLVNAPEQPHATAVAAPARAETAATTSAARRTGTRRL